MDEDYLSLDNLWLSLAVVMHAAYKVDRINVKLTVQLSIFISYRRV